MSDIAFQNQLEPKRSTRRRRKEKPKCGRDEFYDDVVRRCSLCHDICETKLRLGLDCFECKGYLRQSNSDENNGSESMNFALMTTLVPLFLVTLLVFAVIIVLAVKLFKQNGRIHGKKKLLDVEKTRSSESLSDCITSSTHLKEVISDGSDVTPGVHGYEVAQPITTSHYHSQIPHHQHLVYEKT